MKDKDTDLIYEAYTDSRESDIIAKVKDKFEMDVEFNGGKWWRLDLDIPREVTGDERFDIWSIADPETYIQHKAEGRGMQKHLGQDPGVEASKIRSFTDEDFER